MKDFFENDLKILLRENGTVLTALTSLVIIVTGLAIVNRPDRWWMSFIAILVLSITLLVFLNAKALIKGAIASMMALFTAAYGFKLGAQLDSTSNGGTFWMMSTFALFFGMLTLSYIIPSVKSRWNSVITILVLNFFTVLTFSSMTLRPAIASVSVGLGSLLVFFFFYKYSPSNLYKKSDMPNTEWKSMEQLNDIYEAALENGYGAEKIIKKNQVSLLLWSDDYAWNLIPITLATPFSVGGARLRKNTLQYDSKNITPWLYSLVQKQTPTIRTRGANIMNILLDTRNTNGKEAKTIGVGIPDSKKKIPVGILPSKELLNNHRKLFTKIESEYKDYNRKLTDKQVYMLDTHLPSEKKNS